MSDPTRPPATGGDEAWSRVPDFEQPASQAEMAKLWIQFGAGLATNELLRASQPDPARSGLTAAQEIWLALTLKAMELAEKTTGTDVEADDEDIADFVRVVTGVVAPLAAMVECGNAAACPDPSLHEDVDVDGIINTLIQERDDYAARLKATDQAWAAVAAERDQARADAKAMRAFVKEFDLVRSERDEGRERVAELEQQHAEARVLVLDLIGGPDNERGLAGTTSRMLRAIYAGHEDEERGDG